MKIYLAQQNYVIGGFASNTAKIIDAINDARAGGADLVVFTEMCVCGYPSADLLYFDEYVDDALAAVDEIKLHTDDVAVIIGAPQRNPFPMGKRLFNAAYFLFEKQVKQVIQKTCLPNYDVFDEYRYFEPAFEWHTIELKGKTIALTICEDIWNLGNHPLYRTCPMDQLVQQSPDLMINISASPFAYTRISNRKVTVKQNVLKYKIPMIYCNAVGAQTDLIFDGASLVFDRDANLCCQLKQFEEDSACVILSDDGTFASEVIEPAISFPDTPSEPANFIADLNISQVRKAIVLGIRDYFSKLGLQRAIVGNSGGIDSAVTLALACEALGSANVFSLLMPSQYSSGHSISDAEQLSRNLGSNYEIIPIEPVFQSFITALAPVYQDAAADVAEENIQARTRGNLLMAVANKFQYVLLNTSNKSELAVGYGTMYGDMAGGLSVLGDCYKLQVYALAREINGDGEIIPKNIIAKLPSAELRPNQFDSESLPPYDMLDPVLYQYIERSRQSSEIKAMGYDPAVVDFVLRLINKNEFKRHQFCPILRVSSKSFGSGRRIPVVAAYE